MHALRFLAASSVAVSLFVTHSSAHACGGCFHPKNDSPSVVTDHRMALSVSKTQTILWDQVRYQGNPAEFAWVLPVGPGARVELARAEWLAALDVATAPQISAPEYVCPNGGQATGSSAGGCGGGAGLDYGGYDNGATPPTNFQSTGDVTVVDQSVVGPYFAVVIRSDSGVAISTWLESNGFEIPAAVAPMLESYASAKLDFLALRLRPDVGVQAMQPVRVITPGADPTLPLRMVAAGTGARVGLLLYVVGEGRYEAASYANATVDPSLVKWDAVASRSNYTELFEGLTNAPNGAWVTEYAGQSAFGDAQAAYLGACAGRTIQVRVPCNDAGDGGMDAATDPDAETDAGADANADAGVDTDAGADADTDASGDAGHECFETHPACEVFDDHQVATSGMYLGDVHLTRLRTPLSTTGLVELRLAGTGAGGVSSRIAAAGFSVPPACSPATTSSSSSGGCACDSTGAPRSAIFPGALGIAALALLRRRRARGPLTRRAGARRTLP